MKASTRYARIFPIIFLVVLLVPLLQHLFEPVYTLPLQGAFDKPQQPTFSFASIQSGQFQQKTSTFLSHHFGFQPDVVRVKNQLDFWFFDYTARQVIVGKDNYLFEKPYVKAHLREDFSGTKLLNAKLDKLKTIQQTLAQNGTQLLVLLAPNKATFYTEFLPEGLQPTANDTTDYEFYKRGLAERGIQHIDFNSLFLQWKPTAQHPLFTRCGTHWSMYGSVLAIDSTVNRMEQLHQSPIAHFKIAETVISKKPQHTDDDLNKLLNLVFPISSFDMAYPQLVFDTNNFRPNVLAIADSYYWSFYFLGINERLFDAESAFWYYNKSVYRQSIEKQSDVDLNNLKNELAHRDFVILMAGEPNLDQFAFGFVEEVYRLYAEEENKRNVE